MPHRLMLVLLAFGLASTIACGEYSPSASAPKAAGTPPATTVAAPPPQASAPQVRTLTGGPHVVYHSDAALPSEAAPRSDGRPTVVWFSATWCTTCASMEHFANDTLREFEPRAAIIEKSIDHDRDAARRYGVRGTPTFVIIDAQGNEVARFFHESSASSFRTRIEAGVQKAGA